MSDVWVINASNKELPWARKLQIMWEASAGPDQPLLQYLLFHINGFIRVMLLEIAFFAKATEVVAMIISLKRDPQVTLILRLLTWKLQFSTILKSSFWAEQYLEIVNTRLV